MAIVAGFLSQNVLKFLLKFGEVSTFVGYNAFTDFFPRYPMQPNAECADTDCIRLQAHYKQVEGRLPLLTQPNQRAPQDTTLQQKTTPQENDWGIEVLADDNEE